MKKILIFLFSFFALYGVGLATVSGTNNSVSYTCTGTTGPYTFSFPAYVSTDITVVEADAYGNKTTILGSTITPVNNDLMNGGSLLLGTACTSGYTLTISRNTAETQAQAFYDNMPALYSNFESGLDKLTMMVQDMLGVPGPQGPTGAPGGNLGFANVYAIENFANLPAAVASIGSTPATLIVDTPQSVTALTIPSTLSLIVTKGGMINVGTSIAILGPFKAGQFQVFSGLGTVTGLTITHPEWFGAVSGGAGGTTPTYSSGILTANTAAINAAFAVAAASNGTLDLSWGPYEVNGPLLFGTTTAVQPPLHMAIKGNADTASQINTYAASGVFVDLSGRRWLTMSGVTFFSHVKNTVAIGMLLGRTNGGVSDGSYNNFNNVTVIGYYTNSALVTISSEVLKFNQCKFNNWNTGGMAYRSSTNNTTIGAVSNYGALFASTNTDITFTDSDFWVDNWDAATYNMTGVWLENTWVGRFKGCSFISNNPDSSFKMVSFVANNGNNFQGPAEFHSCHLEALNSLSIPYIFYFDYAGASGNYYNIYVRAADIIASNGLNILGYKSKTASSFYFVDWYNSGSFDGVLADAPNMDFPYCLACTIHEPSNTINMWGNLISSDVTAYNVTYQGSAASAGSLINDNAAQSASTGWSEIVGTSTKAGGAWDTSSITTAQLAQVVRAIQDVLIAHGIIGP